MVLREYRERLGWSREDLAAKSGLSLPCIIKIENNGCRPWMSSLRLCCRAMGISVGQVVTDAEHREFRSDPRLIQLFT